MLLKLLIIGLLTVGVFGRSIRDTDETYNEIATVYCKANNVEDKTQEVKTSMLTFKECVKGLFDIYVVKEEFIEAMRSKAFDQFFKKQCTKAPQFKSCVQALVAGMSPCLPANYASSGVQEVNTLIDFACENEGASLTLFFKDDGPQCIQDQLYPLVTCREAMASNATRMIQDGGMAAAFRMTQEERCSLVEPAMECLVAALKRCPKPNPGKLVEELHKKTPCYNVNQTAQTTTERQ